VLTYRRHRGPDPSPKITYAESDVPRVSVQLPVFNEGYLAEQSLRLSAALDYPHHKPKFSLLMIRPPAKLQNLRLRP